MGKDGKGGKHSMERRARRAEYAPTMAPERRGEIPAWSMAAKERVSYDADIELFDSEVRLPAKVVELAPEEVAVRVDPTPAIDTMVTFYLPMDDGGDDLLMVGVVVSKRQGEAWTDGVSIRLNPLKGASAQRYRDLLANRSLVPRATRSEPSLGFELDDE